MFTFPFAVRTYPPNQNCVIRISNPYQGGRLSLKFTDMGIGAGDTVQVRNLCLHFFSWNQLFVYKRKKKRFRDPAKKKFQNMYNHAIYLIFVEKMQTTHEQALQWAKNEKKVYNKELLDKCERGNKIAPLWHKCWAKWGTHMPKANKKTWKNLDFSL